MIDMNHPTLAVSKQCELLSVNRSTFYYQPKPLSDSDVDLMRRIDAIHMKLPFYGSRRIRDQLETEDIFINRKKVQRLMLVMGIIAIFLKKKTTISNKAHRIYPYRLRGLNINRSNQVWATDITYIPMAKGFVYLVAVIDWFSRKVLSWRLSNTMDTAFCIEALKEAIQRYGKPDIFNTDQGSQFTSDAFTSVLIDNNIEISMDGRGRWLDNVFIERLWRSLKYENIYLKAYDTVPEVRAGIDEYFRFFNEDRRHQNLKGRQTPDQIYYANLTLPKAA